MGENIMLTVLKIGGSVITDKSKPYSIRRNIVRRIARELKPYLSLNNKLILVHGGGSYGHYIVRMYDELARKKDAQYYSMVTISMNELSLKIAEILRLENIPVTIVPSHVVFRLNKENNIEPYNIRVIIDHLEQGIIPILYGDLVLGRNAFPVLSGDDISWYLACKLKASRLLFATSVDGIYAGPVGKSPIIELIKCSDTNIEEIIEKSQKKVGSSIDVTGGIMNKIFVARKYGCSNIDVIIFNGLVEDNIRKVLLGEKILGTKVLL